MAKRRPDHQLTQENWDDDVEKPEVGQFQKADENEIKSRVIRVAKRRIGQSTSNETDEKKDTDAKPVSVFSGFSLISNKSSTIGGDAAPAKPTFSFGSGFSSQPSGALFTSSSTASAAAFGALSKSDADGKSSDFITKLKDLNDAVLKCIKGHVESGKACILTPIFKDYEKYVKELEDKDKKAATSTSSVSSPVKANNVNSSATGAAPTFSFSFSAAKSTAATESSGTTNAASSIVSAPTATPMFSFGKPTTTFGGASSSSGFSFSSAAKPAESEKKGDNENGNTENADDESDEPPKVEFKPVVEEESIYSKRCKVFVKEDGDYKDRGTGTLYLKKVKDDKVQLIVRADTNLGNILLNFLLTSAAPPKRLKNNVMIVCVPTPESDPTKPKSVLVRVKTEDDANELLQEIEQYQ